MELNITKQTVSINELSFNQNVEQGVDFTVNVPEYCGSIQRILKYCLNPRIFSKSINGQILSVEGNACFSIIYIDESGCVSSYECVTPFSKSIDLGANLDYLCINVKPRCSYINAKAITSSRVDVNSVIELSIKVFSKKTTEIISDIDCPDVFANRGEAPATIPINCSEKSIIIEDEIALPSDYPSIQSLLRYDSSVSINDTKIVNDKIIAKGQLDVHALYSAENRKNLFILDQTLPFSQIIDIDGINENCSCSVSAEIMSLDIKPKSNYDGEIRCLALCAKLCLTAEASCNNNIAVIFDAYSSKYDTVSETNDTVFEKHINSLSEVFACKKNIEFSEGDVANIIDIWGSAILQGYRTEGNSIVLNGCITVCSICENSEGEINYFERPIDFEYKTDCENNLENMRFEPLIDVVGIKHTASVGGSIEIVAELSLIVKIFEIKKINILTAFSAKNEPVKYHNDCSVIIYYAERGELTWNIAKRFNASPEDIMSVNSVSSVIPENMPLVISC